MTSYFLLELLGGRDSFPAHKQRCAPAESAFGVPELVLPQAHLRFAPPPTVTVSCPQP